MRNVRLGAAGIALAISLVAIMILQPGAAGAGQATLSISAGAFEFHGVTHHTDSPPCAAPVVPLQGAEDRGTVNDKGGSIASVNLPQGATVTRFSLTARDNDGDDDTFAYLVRKRISPLGTLDGFNGYKVMASTHSHLASQVLRRFNDGSIVGSVIDNANYTYSAEVVNCLSTIDWIGVQVVYTKP